MRAVVFGGTGMLGREVVAEGRRRAVPTLGLSHAAADVTDAARLLEWVRSFRADVVVNCAAFTAVDACEEERDRAYAVNARGAGNAAAAAAALGAHLLHVSTDYVFDGAAQEPYLEEADTAPRSVYGASKRAGEEQVLEYEHSTVVRTSWLFGPGGPNFVATMLRLIDGGRVPLRVVDDQVGCPTDTRFLARALWDLARIGAESRKSSPGVPGRSAGATTESVHGIVHYRNREPVSWCGFTREIVRSWRPSVDVIPVTTDAFPRPAPRPAYSVLAVDRFERLTGRPVEPWSAGLQSLLDLHRRGRTEFESP